MTLDDLQTGMVITGIITGRSVSVPSPGSAITYTVTLNLEGGSVSFEGVAPQQAARWDTYMPAGTGGELPELYPFPIGHRVPVHVERMGEKINLTIDRGEIPLFGGCN